jgi:hypothetical protein
MQSTLETVIEGLRIGSVISAAIPLYAYLKMTYSKPTYLRHLIVLIMVGFCSDLASLTLVYAGLSPNFAGNFFMTFQFFLLLRIYYLFYRDIFERPRIKTTLWVLTGIFIVILILDSFLLEGISENQSVTRTFAALVFIIYSTRFYLDVLTSVKRQPAKIDTLNAPIWINHAIIFYFGFGFYIFATFNYFSKINPDEAEVLWTFHNMNNIIKNILFAVAIVRGKQDIQ